jgi:hypothetical protein
MAVVLLGFVSPFGEHSMLILSFPKEIGSGAANDLPKQEMLSRGKQGAVWVGQQFRFEVAAVSFPTGRC